MAQQDRTANSNAPPGKEGTPMPDMREGVRNLLALTRDQHQERHGRTHTRAPGSARHRRTDTDPTHELARDLYVVHCRNVRCGIPPPAWTDLNDLGKAPWLAVAVRATQHGH